MVADTGGKLHRKMLSAILRHTGILPMQQMAKKAGMSVDMLPFKMNPKTKAGIAKTMPGILAAMHRPTAKPLGGMAGHGQAKPLFGGH